MKTIHKCFFYTYERQISMLSLMRCEEYGHIRTWYIYNASKTVIEIEELLPQVEIKHKHMYSLYIASLCNIAFPMARFSFIVTCIIM